MDELPVQQLASLLGLKSHVADYLLIINEDLRPHQSDIYWIHRYFERQYSRYQNPETYSRLLILESIGFTKLKAEYLSNFIEQNHIAKHQSLLYWSKFYIKNTYEDLINGKNEEMIFKKINISIITVRDYEELKKRHNIMLSLYINQESKSIRDTTYWFHGTDHDSANNILQNGIILSKGTACGDYSNNSGFYLTSDFMFAYKWSTLYLRKNSAIIVFKMQNELEDSKGLDLTSKHCRITMEKVVVYYKNECEDISLEWLENYKYIFGPMEKNTLFSDEELNIGKTYHQLCIKDQMFAKEIFNKCLNISDIIVFKK